MKRDRPQVIYDILKAIQQRNGMIKPTHIMYKANLSHQMLGEYLRELKTKDFIIEQENKSGKTFSLNHKGFEYLQKFNMIRDFMDSFGLN